MDSVTGTANKINGLNAPKSNGRRDAVSAMAHFMLVLEAFLIFFQPAIPKRI